MDAPRRRRPRPHRLFIKTRDGWKLAAYRYWRGEGSSVWGPVVLIHGLGANRQNMDAPDPRISLACYLRERGHDVWVIELRGAGRSRPPRWPLQRRKSYDFDDYVHLDVPAIVRRVLDKTGRRALHWVGHSMGGMLAYAALENFNQHLFKSVVTVGSPGFTGVKHPLADRLHRLSFMLRVLPWLPYRKLGLVASFFPETLSRAVGRVAANPEHMEPRHLQVLARSAIVDLPATLMDQFSQWYGSRTGFSRNDGLFEYYEHLDRINVPILIIAGAGDVLTPLADLALVYARIRASEKKLLVCGKQHGFSLDYGHIDMILGTRARREVYPHIAAWIESHSRIGP